MHLREPVHPILMKQIIFIMALASGLGLQAQRKEIRLHAFSQEISGGANSAISNDKGETRTNKKAGSKNLFIYLEVPAGDKIEITELWIKGKKYRFEPGVQSSPVTLNTGLNMPGQQETILIPPTKNELIRITPFEQLDITDKTTRKLAKHNEIVVYFNRNGKRCQRMLEKAQEVDKMVME
jgi:hypothetical protein